MMKAELTMRVIDWTRLPSLTALRSFEAAVRTQSFSAAARSLNVTHAAVAQQVRILEDHLGIALLQRSPRGVTPTPAGKDLADRLSEAFQSIADGLQELREGEDAKPIRVTTTTYFAEAVVFPHIASFWREHPECEIAFTPTDQSLDLVDEGYDLAIRAGAGNWDGLQVIPFFESPTIACAAPEVVDNPATDWAVVPWLLPREGGWEDEAIRSAGLDPDTIPRTDVGNPSLEIRAAEQAMGLVVESEVELWPQLQAGSLKVAPVPITHVSRYFIVTPPWGSRPAVQNLIRWFLKLRKDLLAQVRFEESSS
ncbi:MAG: LysR family transcriptional regulator [Rhodobacteraceae bacterium]|nr:LysR family transcriptional regulator [Paracoccaceae bacterium]